MTKIRVGVIGCGPIAQMMHLPHLTAMGDRFEVAAVCDLNGPLARRVAERFHVPEWTTDYRTLLTQPVDAFLVLTSGSHAGICLDLLHAGKRVFVEKPLCYTPQEGERLIAARRYPDQIMVGYMKRHDPGYLKALALARAVGGGLRAADVLVLHPEEALYQEHHHLVEISAPAPDPGALARQRSAAREAVGEADDLVLDAYIGVLLGSMVHDVNAVRHLVGEIETVRSCHIGADGRSVFAAWTFTGGAVGRTGWFFLPELRHYVERIDLYADAERIGLHFPSPYLRNFPTAVTHERMEGGAWSESRFEVGYQEAFEEELFAFHRMLADGRAPDTSLEDALADVRVLAAMARSAASGRPEAPLAAGPPRPGDAL